MRNLRALSADTIISDATSVGNKTLGHPPDQDVMLAYDVVKDWTGRFRHPAEFHGTLMPDYLELTGDGKPIAVMQYHLDQAAYTANPESCQIK